MTKNQVLRQVTQLTGDHTRYVYKRLEKINHAPVKKVKKETKKAGGKTLHDNHHRRTYNTCDLQQIKTPGTTAVVPSEQKAKVGAYHTHAVRA